MTHSTEQERAEFEQIMRNSPAYKPALMNRIGDRYEFDTMESAWQGFLIGMQAARRAQVVPQGWKLVPEESTDAMARAFRADDAPYYFTMTTIRCNDFAERWRAVIAAAPQPPEAAPVQMPETVGVAHSGQLDNVKDGYAYVYPVGSVGADCKLYTEQQVRQLLAAHGIK